MATIVLPGVGESRAGEERPVELAAWQRPDRWFFGLIERVEARYGELASALLVAFFAEAISFLFASTMTDYFRERFTGLSANPFARGPVGIPFPEHRLRILGPVVAWAIGLRGYAGIFVPVAFNIPLLALLYTVVRRRTTQPLAATLTLLLATTHLTMTSRTLLGYHDTMVFLCAAAAMVCRSTPLGGLFFLLGMFGDPRVVLMVPMMFVWRLTQTDAERPVRDAVTRAGVYFALAAGFAVASRFLLALLDYQSEAGRETARYISGDFLRQMMPSYLHLSAFLSFKAGWLLVFLGVWLWAARRPMAAVILFGNMLLIFAAGLLVLDFSRALTFCFPIAVLGAIELYRVSPRLALPVVGVCYLVNLITPFYQGMTKGLWIQSYPLPVDDILWLLGR
jgi:hypothetical protein